MTSSLVASRPRVAAIRSRRFWWHYAEMLVAMAVGMAVLAPLWRPLALDRADLEVLAMVVDMTVGMAAWMRFRGHSSRGIVEMSASMYLPFAVLLVPYWAGLAGAGVLMTWGHLLMLPSMALVMLLRAEEYTH